MLPDSKKFKGEGVARSWVLAISCVLGAFVSAWLAFDQIVGKEQVIAKFSPSAPQRKSSLEGSEEPTRLASLSVTASSVAPVANGMPVAVIASAPAIAAPLASAPVTSAPAGAAKSPDVLVKPAFEQWVRLWQARDVNAYIGLYDAERPDLKNHLQVRSSRISKAQFIEVSVSEVSFRQSAPLETTVRFVQSYRSDSHQSRDIKELVWRTDGNQARIIAERLVN